jgi:DNA mismatch repair protein MutL
MCFERHATSKIRLRTCFLCIPKDFVVALASIAAIAHVEMTKQDQEELGTQIIVEGKFVSQDMAVLPKGTSFAVKNLFSIFQHVVIF